MLTEIDIINILIDEDYDKETAKQIYFDMELNKLVGEDESDEIVQEIIESAEDWENDVQPGLF